MIGTPPSMTSYKWEVWHYLLALLPDCLSPRFWAMGALTPNRARGYITGI